MMDCYDDDFLVYCENSHHKYLYLFCTFYFTLLVFLFYPVSDPVGVVRLNPISKDDKRIKGGKLGDRDGGSGSGKKHHPSDSMDGVGDSGRSSHTNRGDTLRVPNIEKAPATDNAGKLMLSSNSFEFSLQSFATTWHRNQRNISNRMSITYFKILYHSLRFQALPIDCSTKPILTVR